MQAINNFTYNKEIIGLFVNGSDFQANADKGKAAAAWKVGNHAANALNQAQHQFDAVHTHIIHTPLHSTSSSHL